MVQVLVSGLVKARHLSPSLPLPPSPLTEQGMQSYFTRDVDLFNRSFSRNEYFYCERTKWFYFNGSVPEPGEHYSHPCIDNVNETKPVCSHVEMSQAVIYPGNIDSDNPGSEFYCTCTCTCTITYNVQCTVVDYSTAVCVFVLRNLGICVISRLRCAISES